MCKCIIDSEVPTFVLTEYVLQLLVESSDFNRNLVLLKQNGLIRLVLMDGTASRPTFLA
jgi:hypothetical protein